MWLELLLIYGLMLVMMDYLLSISLVPRVSLESDTKDVFENVTFANFVLTREGDLSAPATVVFRTRDLPLEDIPYPGDEAARGRIYLSPSLYTSCVCVGGGGGGGGGGL